MFIERQLIYDPLVFIPEAKVNTPISFPTFSFSEIDFTTKCAISMWIYPIPRRTDLWEEKEFIIFSKGDEGDQLRLVWCVTTSLLKIRKGTWEQTAGRLPVSEWNIISVEINRQQVRVRSPGKVHEWILPTLSLASQSPLTVGETFRGIISSFSIGVDLPPDPPQPSYPLKSSEEFSQETFPIRSLLGLAEGDYSKEPSSVIPLRPRSQSASDKKREFLFCHDLMGGYGEWDKWLHVAPHCPSPSNAYRFHHWEFVDTFVYFSHQCVSIPTIGWIHAAHKHGVRVLGTLITEWEAGEAVNRSLAAEPERWAKQLAALARHFGFEGWFVNIEAEGDPKGIATFVSALRKLLPGHVVWYDSLTREGKVEWQDALNEKNEMFFHVSDTFFLNYGWDLKKLATSAKTAGNRINQVFASCDVFGRGTFGGGQFDTYRALEAVEESQHPFSFGLFAPGWTFELSNGSGELFQLRDEKLWLGRGFRQLLRNPTGENGMEDWEIISNGGSGWKVVDLQVSRFWPKAFATSNKWCVKAQEVSLLEFYSQDFLDSSPEIFASILFRGEGPKYDDFFRWKIELRDANHQPIQKFDSGELRTSSEWETLRQTFRHYGAGLRYIYWEDAGKDVEGWSGQFGTRITGALLVIRDPLKDSKNGIAQHWPSSILPSHLPFSSFFGDGVGQKFCIQGKKVSDSGWSNMSEQDPLPSFPVFFEEYEASDLVGSTSHEIAFEGGASFSISGKITKPTRYPLFRVQIESALVHVTLTSRTVGSSSMALLLYGRHKGETKRIVLASQEDTRLSQIGQVVLPVDERIVSEDSQWIRRNWSFENVIISEVYVVCYADEMFECQLGHFAIFQDNKSLQTEMSPVGWEVAWSTSSALKGERFQVTLQWETSKAFRHYDIFEGGKWIGRSFTTCFTTEDVTLPKTLEIRPTTWEGIKLPPTVIHVKL